MKEVKNITVLGAGAMGATIAAIAAEAGYKVTIRDVDNKFLDKGRQVITEGWDKRVKRGEITAEAKNELMGRLSFVVDTKEAVKNADMGDRGHTGDHGPEEKVAKEVSELAPDDMIYATNTSSLSITEIRCGGETPERVVGAHYFNPPAV